MQFDWLKVFWPISQEQDIYHRISAGTQQIISISIIEQIQWKLIKNYFFKIKKIYFWPISPYFGAKEVFMKNPVVIHNFIRLSNIIAKFREISRSNSKKTSWQMSGREGWTDPISQDLSSCRWRSNKYNCSTLALNIQR